MSKTEYKGVMVEETQESGDAILKVTGWCFAHLLPVTLTFKERLFWLESHHDTKPGDGIAIYREQER
jgi:hypothetical protein